MVASEKLWMITVEGNSRSGTPFSSSLSGITTEVETAKIYAHALDAVSKGMMERLKDGTCLNNANTSVKHFAIFPAYMP